MIGSARPVIGWLAFLIFSICCALAFVGVREWALAAVAVVAALALFWALGADVIFHRSFWFGTPEQDAELARMDQEIRAHETWREERRRRLTT